MAVNGEGMHSIEHRESPPPRSFEIVMVRHGKQFEASDPKSELSPEGEQQARDFGANFVREHLHDDMVVKIKRSTVQRASRTAECIEEGMRQAIEEFQNTNIKLLTTRNAAPLRTTGALGPVMQAGVPYEKAVDTWLKEFDRFKDARHPEEIVGELRHLVDRTSELSERLPENGPSIAYIWVTHETAHAALMHSLTGKTTEELGGGIGHLEPIVIDVSSGQPPVIRFRDQEFSYDQETREEGTP